jgi:hypothetical protein
MLFDWLVVGQLLAVNVAHAVRGPKYVVRRGKTPVPTEDQARRLLEGIDTSTAVGRGRRLQPLDVGGDVNGLDIRQFADAVTLDLCEKGTRGG